jgi:PEGA domain-containing protein
MVKAVPIAVLFALPWGCAATCRAQDGSANDRAAPASKSHYSPRPTPAMPQVASAPISAAETHLYATHPRLNAETIEQDKRALRLAFPFVWSHARSQLSDSDTGVLLATVWTDYRSKYFGSISALDDDKVIALANGYGGVRVTTTPKGATVWVDDKKWEGQTELTAFTTAGKRTIRVGGLSGYKDDKEKIEVVPGTILEIKRELSQE